MAQQLISEISTIQQKMATNMTPAQTADWRQLLEKRLDALEALEALENPVDEWGRTEAQQKEDAENPCRCPEPQVGKNNCCGSCGFWIQDTGAEEACDCCYRHDYDPFPARSTGSTLWRTCFDCGTYVEGYEEHKKICGKIWLHPTGLTCFTCHTYVTGYCGHEETCAATAAARRGDPQ